MLINVGTDIFKMSSIFLNSLGVTVVILLPRDANAMHKRGLCRHAVSVCVSVRPSVRHVRELCQNE